MTYKTPTLEAIRKAYVEVFLQRYPDALGFANFTETKLAEFIRKYVDSSFGGVYACLDHNFYDRVRNMIATNPAMVAEDTAANLAYSIHLKRYSDFLESKAFRKLCKIRINTEVEHSRLDKNKELADARVSTLFREETEGVRKHIIREMDVVQRNPQLRQQCLDIYGYQCQCCGMNFAELYGDGLGGNFIEVHHLKPISTFEKDGVPDDFLDNLVPLCSNCHSMIHHIVESEHPLRDLRSAYKGVKKAIKIWKPD